MKKKWQIVLLLVKVCLSFILKKERVDEEENVTNSLILKDIYSR